MVLWGVIRLLIKDAGDTSKRDDKLVEMMSLTLEKMSEVETGLR